MRGKKEPHRAYSKKGVLRPVIIPRYKEIDTHIIKGNREPRECLANDILNCLKSVNKIDI